MKISSGRKKMPQRVVIYGPEGIGKSTLASQFPNPIVIDTEGSTSHIDIQRFDDKPDSWPMLLNQVKYVLDNSDRWQTLVIDTGDWAEHLAKTFLCDKNNWTSIAQPGYGQGYMELEKTYGELLNGLNQVLNKGVNVVIVAHSQVKTFEQPDEVGSYDRYELKLEKKTAALIKEWADAIIFINYETFITNKDKQGKGTAKGGKRVMHFNHEPAWDAKNRWGLNEPTYDLDYSIIAPYIYSRKNADQATAEPIKEKKPDVIEEYKEDFEETKEETPFEEEQTIVDPALQQLMNTEGFTLDDVLFAIYAKGVYPHGTAYENMDESFIKGAVIGQWDGLKGFIKKIKDEKRVEF